MLCEASHNAGKLNFYISAVDEIMRTPVDGPTIGLLLCESRSGPVVEYALQNIAQPIGVSTYRVTRELPTPIREEVPTVEDLEEVVTKLRGEMEALPANASPPHVWDLVRCPGIPRARDRSLAA
jgi:YhcG PDDEXK nuclease domain